MNYMWALYGREIKRFRKLWLDTLFGPIVSIVLYLAVFGVVLGDKTIEGVTYAVFVYTGLLGMVMVNSGFANPGFALVIGKNLGTNVDLQITPIPTWQIGLSFALAALTRGLVTLLLAIAITIWFVPGVPIKHPLMLVSIILLTGLQFGMLGVIFGMWAKGFESLTFMTTFILQPLIFLAGVFYPIAILPSPWNVISEFNPIHHTINLFRYSFLDYSDTNIWISWTVVLLISMMFFALMNYSTAKNLKG